MLSSLRCARGFAAAALLLTALPRCAAPEPTPLPDPLPSASAAPLAPLAPLATSAPVETAAAAVPAPDAGAPPDDTPALTLPTNGPPLPAIKGPSSPGCRAFKIDRTDRAKLEKAVAAGDPCAFRALADHLTQIRYGLPDDYRRALALAAAAFDAGVDPDCYLFELAHDDARARSCWERAHDEGRAALFYLDGLGGPKDPARAKALAAKVPADDCSRARLDAVLAQGPGATPHPYWDTVGCDTTPALGVQRSEEMIRAAWRTSAARGAAHDALDPLNARGREAFVKLLDAFSRYAEAETQAIYWAFADGTFRSLKALGVEAHTREAFDALIAAIAARHTLPDAADPAALAAKLSVRAVEDKLFDGPIRAELAPDFHKQFAVASAAFKPFEEAVVALATTTIGGADADRRARAAARALRVDVYEYASQP